MQVIDAHQGLLTKCAEHCQRSWWRSIEHSDERSYKLELEFITMFYRGQSEKSEGFSDAGESSSQWVHFGGGGGGTKKGPKKAAFSTI